VKSDVYIVVAEHYITWH